MGDSGWSSLPEGLHLMEGIHDRAVDEELQLVGKSHTGEVHAVFTPMGGTLFWSRETV